MALQINMADIIALEIDTKKLLDDAIEANLHGSLIEDATRPILLAVVDAAIKEAFERSNSKLAAALAVANTGAAK